MPGTRGQTVYQHTRRRVVPHYFAPEVIECNRVTGSESHVLRAWCRDLAHLDELIEAFWQYGDTITNVVTATPVQRRSCRFW